MLFFLTLKSSLLAVIIAVNSGLAFFVYRNNKKSATNVIFVTLSIVTSAWLIVMYFASEPAFYLNILLYTRLAIFLAVPQSVLVFLLAHTLPSEKLLIGRKLFLSIILVALGVMALTLSPFVFKNIHIEDGHPVQTVAPGIGVFAFFVSFFTLVAIYTLVKKILSSKKSAERQQLLFMAWGITLMFGSIIATIMIPVIFLQNDYFVQFAPIFVALFLGMTTYAIARHHLFDLRVIATEVFAAIIILISLINTLLSQTVEELLLRSTIFVLTSIFGFLLIRGTLREIRELERLSESKSEFVSIASHQLRTPLTAIKGFLSMIKEGKLDPETQKDWLEKAYESNERLIRLVADLLDISRIERGSMKYEFKETDIASIVAGVVEELKIPAQKKNVTLKWEKPKHNMPLVKLDEQKIRQVLMNLTDNAMNYTENGTVTIRLVSLNQLNRVQIMVKDTGVGMSKEDIQNLFNIFSRGANVKKTHVEGMGLGLYIADKIVKAHGGKIWATSEGPHKGSTFYVELPIR